MTQFQNGYAVADIYDAMRTDLIGEQHPSDLVGGGFPFPIAMQVAQLMVDHANLGEGKSIYDIGCGCGRIAALLTQHIGVTGHYTGVDILPGLVDWANQHIASRYPNFDFAILAQSNDYYDQYKTAGSSRVIPEVSQSCADGSIDIAMATSLFTHLNSQDADRMLKEFSRALKPMGCAFITAFLLDDASRALIDRQRAMFTFKHPYGEGLYSQGINDRLGCVAFDYSYFVGMAARAGFYIDRIIFGDWAGRPNAVTGQDLMILRKF